MPLYKRKPFERLPPPDGLKDTEEIYYCELSKEAFRKYEHYFERMMLLNSTVWSCSLTYRSNLTFSEALDSEKKARKILKNMNAELKAPILIIANATMVTSITEMVDQVFGYMNVRYFKEEICFANETNSEGQKYQRECQVLAIIGSKTAADADKIKYRVKRIDTSKPTQPFVVTGDEIHRKRAALSKEKLKLFLKQCVKSTESGQLKIKDDIYKKHVTDVGIDGFSDIFPGQPPVFEISKVLAAKIEKQKKKQGPKDGKQTTMSKYLTKSDGKMDAETKESKAKREAEQMRIKAEAERKAELEKQLIEENKRRRAEMQQMALSTYHSFNQVKDDLELRDQKRIIPTKPVKTLIPVSYFGDALMVLEFIYSFSELLEDKDKFPKGYSLDLLQRSLLCREVAGPLSDIIQVLLGTLFSLQVEEANEVEISYVYDKPIEPDNRYSLAISEATKAAKWTSTYLAMNMNELPMDATTVSELLRLHLLMSGANVNESASRWRFQQRGGYDNQDDPGLTLRLQKPHIIRALINHSVYELPVVDILSILKCLVDQILTFSTVRDTVEERLDKSSKARAGLKALYTNERKNKANLIAAKKRLTESTKKSIEESDADQEKTAEMKAKFKEEANRNLDKEMKNLDFNYEREKKEFNKSLEMLKQDVFAYQQCLGTDRAYRSYWLFESLPGLFIEHQPFGGQCFENPVTNIHELANCTSADRFSVVKAMVSNQYYGNDKENEIDNYLTKKKNGNNVKVSDDPSILKSEPVKWSQVDLLMCTGDASTCPVHPKFDPKRPIWSFLHTEEELDALIESLNPKGVREKALRDNLESEKELILNHIKVCQVNKLQVDPAKKEAEIEELYNMKTYKNANMSFPKETNICEIIESTLVEHILEMEMNVKTGHLGSIKVKDRTIWREALEKHEYDRQCDALSWGPDNQFHEGNIKLNGTHSETKKIVFDDLTSHLGNSADIDFDESIEDAVCMYQSPRDVKKVHGLASALLQIAQGVEPMFLKPPFGFLKELKDKHQQEKLLKTGRENLVMWSVSLMHCTSYSQVYLHYNILHDSIKWHKSSLNATCIFCRRRSDPDKMLLCDGCNAGKHLFCFKPKLTKVPEEDWFCEKCRPVEKKVVKKKKPTKRTIFQHESDDDGQLTPSEAEEDGDENTFYRVLTSSSGDESTCTSCNKPGIVLISCETCYREVHLKCAKPPVKIRSKKPWYCHHCKEKPNFQEIKAEILSRKRKQSSTKPKANNDAMDSDDSDAEVIAIKVRRLQKKKESEEGATEKDFKDQNQSNKKRRNSKRSKNDDQQIESSSRRNSRRIEDDDSMKTNGTSRRSRRAGDELLLDNAVCCDLLVDIKNHKDSWPFDRPVNKAEVPDYYNVIERPMDFAKIKSKLNLGEYSSNYDFMNDIQLVFTNCDLYNTSGSEIYQSGVNLETFIQSRCADLNLPFIRSDMISDSSEPKRKKQKT